MLAASDFLSLLPESSLVETGILLASLTLLGFVVGMICGRSGIRQAVGPAGLSAPSHHDGISLGLRTALTRLTRHRLNRAWQRYDRLQSLADRYPLPASQPNALPARPAPAPAPAAAPVTAPIAASASSAAERAILTKRVKVRAGLSGVDPISAATPLTNPAAMPVQSHDWQAATAVVPAPPAPALPLETEQHWQMTADAGAVTPANTGPAAQTAGFAPQPDLHAPQQQAAPQVAAGHQETEQPAPAPIEEEPAEQRTPRRLLSAKPAMLALAAPMRPAPVPPSAHDVLAAALAAAPVSAAQPVSHMVSGQEQPPSSTASSSTASTSSAPNPPAPSSNPPGRALILRPVAQLAVLVDPVPPPVDPDLAAFDADTEQEKQVLPLAVLVDHPARTQTTSAASHRAPPEDRQQNPANPPSSPGSGPAQPPQAARPQATAARPASASPPADHLAPVTSRPLNITAMMRDRLRTRAAAQR